MSWPPPSPAGIRNPALPWLTGAAALGAALNAGVFLAFSVFVMPPVRDLPPAQGIAAMQGLDRVAPAAYTPLAFGTLLLCGAALVVGLTAWRQVRGVLLVAGVVTFVVAAVLVTFSANVPLSATVDGLDPGSAGDRDRWAGLGRDWSWWNHLRTLGTLASAALLAVAVRPR